MRHKTPPTSKSSDSNSSSDTDTYASDSSEYETQVLEVPMSAARAKKIIDQRDHVPASKNRTSKSIDHRHRSESTTSFVSSVDDTADASTSSCTSCTKYKDKIRELRAKMRDMSILGIDEPNRIALKVPIIDITGKTARIRNMPGRVCDWDTEPFDWEPTMIPMGIIDGKVTMIRYFCSAECSAAYNLRNMNDANVWKRKNLIDRMESIRRGKSVVVNVASHPDILKKFGGEYSIKDWRKRNTSSNKCYRPLPAMIVPVGTIVEADHLGIGERTDTIGGNDLVLKRETPLNYISSLEKSMGLKIQKNYDSDDEAV